MSSSPLKSIGEGNIRTLLEENEAPVTRISTPSVSNIMVRSKLLCPDVCSKECSWRCPKECCSERKHEIENEDNWSPTPQGNFFACWLVNWLIFSSYAMRINHPNKGLFLICIHIKLFDPILFYNVSPMLSFRL